MPLDHKSRVAERMGAGFHRQRRCRHQQIHHAITDHAAEDSDNEGRLPGNFGQRPPLILLFSFGQARNIHYPLQNQRHDAESDQHQITAHEFRWQDVLGQLAGLWSEDATDKAPGHHQ